MVQLNGTGQHYFYLVVLGGVHNTFLDVSYDPIDYPPQFFTLKDKRPVLYIDPVVDNREIATKTQMGITF